MPDDSRYSTPGQLIEDLLNDRGWSQRVLAVVLSANETGINMIIRGKRSVDAELALSLGEIFQVPPERFLALQQSLDLKQAQLFARSDPGLARRANLFGSLPIAEMIKRGWLKVDDIKDFTKVENEVAKFFGETDANKIEVLPHAAKKTNVSSGTTSEQLAWLYRVNQIAGEMVVPRYSPAAGRDAVKKISGLLASAEEARKVPRILGENGIRFVIVESLPDAKIDGVCLWLDDSKPVIALTLRHDRIDNFWFVLRHEMEHVLQGHGQSGIRLDLELEGERAGVGAGIAEEERIANEAAAEFCVPQKTLNAFIARKAPFFAERDFLAFARMLKIHPGVLAGQLHHKTGRFELFQKHLTKIRSIVSPSALVDGWGDVVPVDN